MRKLVGRAAVSAATAAAVTAAMTAAAAAMTIPLAGVAAAQTSEDPPAPLRGASSWRHCLAHNLKLYCPDRKNGRVVIVDLQDRAELWRRA